MKTIRFEGGLNDPLDARIVTELGRNARVSIADLARLVGLSAPSVAERVRRLEDAGVIAGYGARIVPAAIGYRISAWLRIRPVPGELARVVSILRAIPEITECDRVTGEDCFVARVHVASVAELERIIDQIIPHAMTNTAIVQSSPITPRPPPLTRDGRGSTLK